MMYDEKEKEVVSSKSETLHLRDQLTQLKLRFQIQDDMHDDEYQSGSEQGIDGWTVDDVYHWWKNNLPKGAQEFIGMVRECEIAGKDLKELDEEMLEQLGIRKLLVMKILKAVRELTHQDVAASVPAQSGTEEEYTREGFAA